MIFRYLLARLHNSAKENARDEDFDYLKNRVGQIHLTACSEVS